VRGIIHVMLLQTMAVILTMLIMMTGMIYAMRLPFMQIRLRHR
jgi:hypothetical protein